MTDTNTSEEKDFTFESLDKEVKGKNLYVIVQDSKNEFFLEYDALKRSQLLQTLSLHTMKFDTEDYKFKVNLNVDENDFTFILEYLVYQNKYNDDIKKNEYGIVTENLDSIKNKYDLDFITKLDMDKCLSLISCANYLGIECLVNLLAYRISHLFTFGTFNDKEKLYNSFGRREVDLESKSDSDDEKNNE